MGDEIRASDDGGNAAPKAQDHDSVAQNGVAGKAAKKSIAQSYFKSIENLVPALLLGLLIYFYFTNGGFIDAWISYAMIFAFIFSLMYYASPANSILLLDRLLVVSLILVFLTGVVCALIGPDVFFQISRLEDQLIDTPASLNDLYTGLDIETLTIIVAVISGGGLGGTMAAVSRSSELELAFRRTLSAVFKGIFVAFSFFLILRAGIITQDSIDTFNVWGISGISMLAGYFSENALNRLNAVFSEAIGSPSSGTDEKK